LKVLIGIVLSLFVLFTLSFVIADSLGVMGEEAIAAHMRVFVDGVSATWIAAPVIALLLTIDLILPIPSSVLMTLCGYFYGILAGTLISFVGAMGSAVLGFGLCRRFGRRGFESIIGDGETERVERLFHRYGDWMIILSRPVPMFTEIISCVCGLTQMSFRRFALLSAAATLPLCFVYAWAGRTAETNPAAWWALLLAVALPAMGVGVLRLLQITGSAGRTPARDNSGRLS